MTHTYNEPKTEVSMDWTHPAFSSGPDVEVEFVYTVVMSSFQFYASETAEGTLTVTASGGWLEYYRDTVCTCT